MLFAACHCDSLKVCLHVMLLRPCPLFLPLFNVFFSFVIRTTKRKCVYHPFFPLLMPSLLAQCLTLTVVIKDTGSKTLRVSRPSILTEPRRLPPSRNIQTNRQTNVTSIIGETSVNRKAGIICCT